jgi:hypothetical protein
VTYAGIDGNDSVYRTIIRKEIEGQ